MGCVGRVFLNTKPDKLLLLGILENATPKLSTNRALDAARQFPAMKRRILALGMKQLGVHSPMLSRGNQG